MNILKYFTKATFKMAPAVFVPHGGGPLPLLGGDEYKGLTTFLKTDFHKHVDLKDIKAIILVTAHWETDTVKISSGKKHDLYFDYYGFPEETYKYRYDAPGDPNLAKKIQSKLAEAGIKSELDDKRGWDHGVFVPMLLINPKADIPIVQVSVLNNQDPEAHFKYGRALYDLRKEGIAIFGSGMSYHNMRSFRTMHYNRYDKVVNKNFDDFLFDACTSDEKERLESLKVWSNHPEASESHPPHAAEHLMPLIVIAGAGGPDKGERILNWDLEGMFRLGSFVWKKSEQS